MYAKLCMCTVLASFPQCVWKARFFSEQTTRFVWGVPLETSVSAEANYFGRLLSHALLNSMGN